MLKYSSPLDTFRFSKNTDVLHVYFTVLYDSHSIYPQATGSCTLPTLFSFSWHDQKNIQTSLVSSCHWAAQNCREVRFQNGQLQPRLQLGSSSVPSQSEMDSHLLVGPLDFKNQRITKKMQSPNPKLNQETTDLMIIVFLHFRSGLLLLFNFNNRTENFKHTYYCLYTKWYIHMTEQKEHQGKWMTQESNITAEC